MSNLNIDMCSSVDENAMNEMNEVNDNEFPNINHTLSVFIPNIYQDESFIKKVFKELNIGEIRKIDFLAGENCQRNAYIYMDKWYNNIVVEHLQEKMTKTNGYGKIVYDDPNFWLLIPNCNEDHISTIYNHISNLNNKITGITDLFCGLDAKFSDYDKRENERNEKNEKNKVLSGSCCGAISDGWYPSEAQRVIKRKRKEKMRGVYNLRPRLEEKQYKN